MNGLFTTVQDPLDGFDALWALWPRDKRRPGRKSRKDRCKVIYKRDKLAKINVLVLAAAREDIAGIGKGVYGHDYDLMKCFPGIEPWLNQQKWDRDLIEPKKEEPRKKEVDPEPKHVAMTVEEFQAKKAYFRERARMKP